LIRLPRRLLPARGSAGRYRLGANPALDSSEHPGERDEQGLSQD